MEAKPPFADCSATVYVPTWRDRFARRFFPSRHLDWPEWRSVQEPPGDCVLSVIKTEFSFLDRLRILLTGRLTVEVKTATQFRVGETVTLAQATPRPWRFADPEWSNK